MLQEREVREKDSNFFANEGGGTGRRTSQSPFNFLHSRYERTVAVNTCVWLWISKGSWSNLSFSEADVVVGHGHVAQIG